MLKDNKAFLSVLGFIIGSLFVLVIMVAYASYILSPIVQPLINATNGTDHQAISQAAVSRGYASIDLAGIAFPVFLVIGFLAYMILRDRQVQ